jgi:hypothetical protein
MYDVGLSLVLLTNLYLNVLSILQYLGCGSSINEYQDSGVTKYCRIYVCNYIVKGELYYNALMFTVMALSL